MAAAAPLVSIITINYNQPEVTRDLLVSLRGSDYDRVEVIVVDNGSVDDPIPALRRDFPEVQFIRSEANLGFSGGNNLGILASRGDFLFFVNNDTELEADTITRLLATYADRPRLGALSPLILYHPEVVEGQRDLIQYAGTTPLTAYTARNRTLGERQRNRGQYAAAHPTAYIHGAAMMIPRRVVAEVGLMPEFFFLYYEELDWSERIRGAGYELYVEPRARIFHKESVSVGQHSPLKTHYLTRNRILFMRRHRSGLAQFVFALFLVFFTIPKNVLRYWWKGEGEQARAFLRAVAWNLTEAKEQPNSVTWDPATWLAQSKTEIKGAPTASRLHKN
ncbi:MAG: glycosyltransferase family 2 protein [Bacteroidota bacterium]